MPAVGARSRLLEALGRVAMLFAWSLALWGVLVFASMLANVLRRGADSGVCAARAGARRLGVGLVEPARDGARARGGTGRRGACGLEPQTVPGDGQAH